LDADVIVVILSFTLYEQVRAELAPTSCFSSKLAATNSSQAVLQTHHVSERKIYRDTSVRRVAVSSLAAAQLKSHFQRGDVTVIPDCLGFWFQWNFSLSE
jgi:CCR4-NOT transcriptional regulation complex NOT5 subunit